ncbi:MAG TPA: urea amidolyase associated protein UAAP1 [Acidimicrobiia bacterium]
METTSDTATTIGARDHARSQAGAQVRGMPTVPASAAIDLPSEPAANALWAETLEPGEYAAHLLPRGARLRLTDLEGDACAHMIVHNAHQTAERLNLADTVKVQWKAYPTAGSRLLSDLGRALLTITADSSGHHDALCGAPNLATHVRKYGDGEVTGPYPNARDRLVVAALKAGLERRDVGPSIAFFKGARVGSDGAFEFESGPGTPGAEVILRCEIGVHVAIANVPHTLDTRPGYPCTPLRITAWQPEDADLELEDAPSPETQRAALNNRDWLGGRG